MRHIDSLTAIYSRWIKTNALPEIGATELTMDLWTRVAEERKAGSALRMLKMREQGAWLDRFVYIWQMAEARHQNSRAIK